MSNVPSNISEHVINRLNNSNLSYNLNNNSNIPYAVFIKNLKALCDSINNEISDSNYIIQLVPNSDNPDHIVLYNTKKSLVKTGDEDIDSMDLDESDAYDPNFSANIYINLKPSFSTVSNGGANKKTKRRGIKHSCRSKSKSNVKRRTKRCK
jgi:hypothetical protein